MQVAIAWGARYLALSFNFDAIKKIVLVCIARLTTMLGRVIIDGGRFLV